MQPDQPTPDQLLQPHERPQDARQSANRDQRQHDPSKLIENGDGAA